MPMTCAIPNCKAVRKPGSDIQIFGFPLKRNQICEHWVKAVGLENWSPTKWSGVCNKHFKEIDYLKRPNCNVKLLKPDAIPSVALSTARTMPIKSNHPAQYKAKYIEGKTSANFNNLTDISNEPKEKELKQNVIANDIANDILNDILNTQKTKDLASKEANIEENMEKEIMEHISEEEHRSKGLDNEQITYNQKMQKPRRGRPKIKSPSKQELKNKIKVLLQKIRRQNQKINNMSRLFTLTTKKLQQRNLLEKDTINFLMEEFEGCR